MGYSTAQCTNIPLEVGTLAVQCPYGTIGEVHSYGVNPDVDGDVSNKALCVVKDSNQFCSSRIRSNFINEVNTACVGKVSCDLNVDNDNLYGANDTSKCSLNSSVFFIQYTCIQSNDALAQKHKEASLVTALGILSCLIFLVAIYYLKRISKLMAIDWDVQTITAGDYTVELHISEKSYNWWLNNVYNVNDRARGVSTGESLKTYLYKEIENTLTRYLREHGHEEEGNNITEVKIADLVFAFNNQDLINLLKERGAHIAY